MIQNILRKTFALAKRHTCKMTVRVLAWLLAASCSVAFAQDIGRNISVSSVQADASLQSSLRVNVQSSGLGSNAAVEAIARLRDIESVTQLTAEGQALYEKDTVKRGAYDYCGNAIRFAERGEFREAIRSASKALFLGVAEKNDDYIAHAKRDLAMAYLYAGDINRAEQYASEALKHWKNSNNRNAVDGVAYKILGDVNLKKGDFDKAVVMYDSAIDMAEGSQRFFSRAAKASAYVAWGKTDKAIAAIEKADSYVGVLSKSQQPTAKTLMLRIRGALAIKEGKANEAVELYQSALPASAERTNTAYERFWILEGLSRAQLLKGDVAAALKTILAALDESEKTRVRFYSEEVKSGLLGEMQDVFGQAVTMLLDNGQPDLAWEISERSRARALLDMMRNRVLLSHEGRTYANPHSKPTKLPELVSQLKSGEVVVGYHVLQNRTHAWIVRASGTKAITLAIGRNELALLVQSFRNALVENQSNSAEIGSKIHELLVRPLLLTKGESLTILPHESLHYLPFQALKANDGFLIENVAVSYVPSGGAYIELAGRKNAAQGKFFALGNPDLGRADLALPGAQREVEAVAAMFSSADAHYGKDATRERFVNSTAGSRWIHVAAHGTVDAIDPLYSKLYLANSATMPGTLEARDVYAMKFDGTALVVLSACETGLGKVSRGDEVWGFTRSFLGAGATALLVSLWPVSDESTELLMKKFYYELNNGSVLARALQRAQLEVMRDKRFGSPYFWGAFNLIGATRQPLSAD